MGKGKLNFSALTLVGVGIFGLVLVLASCGSDLKFGMEISAAPAPTPTPDPRKRIFVTSTSTFQGSLGGKSGDRQCMDLASTQMALKESTWKAWLSTTTTNAKDIVLVNGETYWKTDRSQKILVFSKVGSITLLAPIDQNELGEKVSSSVSVWTGTTAAGISDGNSCSDWGSSDAGFQGSVGTLTAIDASWTFNNSTPNCNTTARLYCAEQ